MNAKYTATLGELLTITTPYLMTEDFQQVKKLLAFMCNDTVYTHQAGRIAAEVRPYLLEQHPFLAEIDASGTNEHNVWERIARWEAQYGKTFEVFPMHVEDHTSLPPEVELYMVAPHLKPIMLNLDEQDES